MRRLFLCVSLWTLLLASCSGPAPVSVISSPQGTETATTPALPTVIPHAEALRFALVGQPTEVNAWALFDEAGASYANYALRSDEYPSMYRLSVPTREFEPYTADGMSSAVTQENAYYVASVKLQTGLNWSDGSPLTAQDVAFTVNTALSFQLGLDWLSAYDPTLLDHAEAVDESAVKFFFKGPFNVGDWQYGALQGPIVSQAYWSPKLTAAAALLPSADLLASLEKTKAEADTLQARIKADDAQLLTSPPNTAASNEINARITRNQNDLNSLNSQIGKLQDEYDAGLTAARAALYALDDEHEPTFGAFLRATKNGDTFTREVNPTYPFEKPNYDRAMYTIIEDTNSAYQAYKQTDLDVVLSPYGGFQEPSAPSYPTSSTYFLVFNPKSDVLAKPELRKAISCIIGIYAMAEWAYDGFTLPGVWRSDQSFSICSDFSREQKIQAAVEILKSAGYSWRQEPTTEQAGDGLFLPDGKIFPSVTLLVTPSGYRANAASSTQQQLQYLGIPLVIQESTPETFRYAVYSTGDFELAILGWRLSAYPGYLCDWFQVPSPFAYNGDRLKSACDALNATADLETARQSAFEIQSILMEDLPFIPLYQALRYDSYRNVSYPFGNVMDGISGLYGAPSLAVPSQ